MERSETSLQPIPPPGNPGFWPLSRLCFSLVILALAGCGAVPNSGPRSSAFDATRHEQVGGGSGSTVDEESLPFILVDVDRKIIQRLSGTEDVSYFKGTFTDRTPPPDVVIGMGDVVRVTIFEAGSGGLFVPTGGALNSGNYVSIPDQEVDQRGVISVPYADKKGDGGLIHVVGRQPIEVQNDIQQRLMNRAIEPQVIVTLVKRNSNLYSVIGDVGAPGRFSLTQGGIRILDAVSAAGGPKGSDYSTLITLQRGATSATALLATLLTQPENNIFVQPGDIIALKKEERFYNVLGATRLNSRVPFDSERLTLADAIAKAGGLNGDVAAPSTVVVFRREDPKILKTMGVKLVDFKDAEPVPTVYRLDFTEPAGMFLAQKLQLRSNDVVYVSNHPFTDASKLLGVLRDVLLIKLIDN